MEIQRKNIFYLGKGGVGKSTVSALTALQLALNGKNVLLVSFDPAHNQSDIFRKALSETPLRITGNLYAKEIDIDFRVKEYLSNIEKQVKQSYSYLTALNLENYFGIIKHSPGIEEYALVSAYSEISKTFSDMDYIVFDMPPTALALKFFGLPELSLLWLEKLLELRKEIIKKRDIITKIKLGKKVFERDKLLNKLNEQISGYSEVKKAFENKELTEINLVLNPDELSFSESELIIKKLAEFNLTVSGIIVNKFVPGNSFNRIKETFKNIDIKIFPLSQKPLLGLDSLEKYLQAIKRKESSFE